LSTDLDSTASEEAFERFEQNEDVLRFQ